MSLLKQSLEDMGFVLKDEMVTRGKAAVEPCSTKLADWTMEMCVDFAGSQRYGAFLVCRNGSRTQVFDVLNEAELKAPEYVLCGRNSEEELYRLATGQQFTWNPVTRRVVVIKEVDMISFVAESIEDAVYLIANGYVARRIEIDKILAERLRAAGEVH